MAITKLKKFKINTHPSNEIGNTLAVGDIVHRQYFDGENVIYSLMYVHEVGTDTVEDKESGESKNSHFFIGSLLYGDAPKSGEVLEFVRITNLIDTDRAGAIYLTASDSESPYIDILDGMTQEKAVYYPNKLGANGYEPFDNVMKATYSKSSGERNRSIVLENDGSSAKLGIKHKSNITNTGVWLVSMFVSASKSADVNVNIKNNIDTDANYTTKINREPTHIFLPVTTNQIGRIGREIEVYSDNLKMKGDWIEISDLTIIQLSDVVKTYSQINARIGKLDGIHDKVYGQLSGYGAYLKDLWATRNANVAGTITAGDKDGFGASFYAGKIHKNILINSLGVNFLNKPIPALSSELSPFGVGNVYKSTSTPVKILAQDKKWVENNLNKEVCFSVFVKADADAGVDFVVNTYNGKVHKENIHPNSGWMRINMSLFLDKIDDLYFEISGNGLFTAPQLEFGDKPTLYQPTDSKLNYTDEYGAWFNRGGIGGTIQNPLLKLNEDGSIESQGDGFKINKDGSGHLAGGALTFDDKHVNISFTDSNIGEEVGGAVSKLDKKIDDEVGKLETNFEIKEGQIATSVKEVRDKTQQIVDLGEEIKVVGDSASKDALSAKNSAEQANKSYNLAKGEASKASSEALDAKNKADIASQKAIEAENKAKEALESAGKSSQSYLDAKKEAELAGLEASSANKDALLAKEKAELAQSKASLAEQEANRAKSEADRASSAKDSVVEMDTSIKQTAEKIESTATQVEKKAGEATEASLKAESEAVKASKNAEDANNKALEAAKKAEEALTSAGASSQAYKDAKLEADKALNEAIKASDKANEASQSALDAQKVLVNVTTKETAINQTAEKIESTASQVQLDASKASESAIKAGKEAEKSAENSSLATTQAELAKKQAEEAEQKALEATKKAQEAFDSAGASSQSYLDAKAKAELAQKEAVKSKEQADLATTKATLAKSEADRAKAEADKAENINTTIVELNTDIIQTAEKIQTTAKEVQANANTASEASKKAETEAQNANTQALSAQQKALEATKKAEEALASAGASSQSYKDAKLEADKAVSEALKASNKAKEANQSAIDAKNSLTNVTKKETAINQTAEKIESTATIVTGDALKAKQAADLATSKATEATANAQTAKDKATEAQLKAEEALKSAGESSQAYKNAKLEADKAVSEATKAANKASEANKSAADAQNALNNAKTIETKVTQTANEVNLNAKKAVESADRAVRAEADINLKADGIVLEASEKSAQKAIDGLEIGGRNLLLNSNLEKTSTGEYVMYANIAPALDIHGEGYYTFSFDLKLMVEGEVIVYSSDRAPSSIKYSIGSTTLQATTEYKRYSVTRYVTLKNPSANHTSLAFFGTYGTGRIPSIKNVKIERGTKATDWTPAPEDIEAQITETNTKLEVLGDKIESNVTEISKQGGLISQNTTKISQNSKEIASKASKAEVDSLTGRVTKAESSIKQSADKIESNVKAVVKAQGDADTAKGLAQQAQDSIDGLEIGGRNLIAISQSNGGYLESGGDLVTPHPTHKYCIIPLNNVSSKLTISTHSSPTLDWTRYAFYTEVNDLSSYIGDSHKLISGSSNVYTIQKPNDAKCIIISWDNQRHKSKIKLEFGTKATDWSPAPEDIEAQISELESSLTQTNNEIKGLVKKTDYDANNKAVNSKISEISQKSDKISLQVTEQDKKLAGVDGRVKKTEIALQPDNIWLTVKGNTQKEINNSKEFTSTIVDARGLDENKWYPITVGLATNVPRYTIIVSRTLSQFADRPTWGSHVGGFSSYVKWDVSAYGWGTQATQRVVESADFAWTTDKKPPIGDIGQMGNSSNEYCYVRGGGMYAVKVYGKSNVKITLRKEKFTTSSQSIDVRTEVAAPVADIKKRPTTEEITTSLKMTDKGISMIGKEIDMTGGITFSMMKDGAGNTLIQGGKVKTDKLNVVDIVAKGIRTNHIEGLTLNFTKGKIGGWGITSSAITKNNVSLTADGSIQNGAKWLLKNDGSGMLASNNIKWDAAGNVTFSGNVKVGLGNLNSTIIANNKIKTSILNANEIVTNGLTADHITGKNLNFKQGTIGGWEIKPTYLRSDKITLDPTGGIKNTSGMWEFNPDGTAKIGKNGEVELRSDGKAIIGGFAFTNNSLISRKGETNNGYVSNNWGVYPKGDFNPYIMLNGATGDAFFKKSRIERSNIVDCFIEGAFLERMNNVVGFPSFTIPPYDDIEGSTIDISKGFNVNLFTRSKNVSGVDMPLPNYFLLPSEVKNKYLGCVIRLQKYFETADYTQEDDGWTNGNNLKPSKIPATVRVRYYGDIEDAMELIHIPDYGYIELAAIKRSDIDIIYPEGKEPPFEEKESSVVWRISHISNEAKAFYGKCTIEDGKMIHPIKKDLKRVNDYYEIPVYLLSTFGTKTIVIKNNSDAVKYRLVGESGGGDMFFVTVHGKRIDVYNGGNGYRRLNQWHGAIAFQTGGNNGGFLITKNIY